VASCAADVCVRVVVWVCGEARAVLRADLLFNSGKIGDCYIV
jgi:hypothetical protein